MLLGRSCPPISGAKFAPLGRLGATSFTSLLTALAICISAAGAGLCADQYFRIKPYLQLGHENRSEANALDIVWFSEEAKHKWQVQYTTTKDKSDKGHECEWISERMISLPGFTAPYYKLTAHLNKIVPGEKFNYKVLRDGKQVFASNGQGKKAPGQSFRVALFGDCGINSEGQRKLAKVLGTGGADLVCVLGDIAYQQGLFSQYLTNFFPVYNLDPAKASDFAGRPTAAAFAENDGTDSMRRTIWAGVLGNHDISLSGLNGTDIDRFPDCLAYYIFWNQPLNGFRVGELKIHKNYSFIQGDLNRQELFKKSAGEAYPVMNNYSFDYGDAHFVALDANYYMDWNDAKLRSWLAEDLKAAQGKAWRILLMHQPGFLIGAPHFREQKMRLISDIAQKYNVNLVLAGHAHCYERSYPLTFGPDGGAKTLTQDIDDTVAGKCVLDTDFDGVKKTRPRGIIHIVSGAGGAGLYPIDSHAMAEKDCFMTRYDFSTHSFSSIDIDDKKLSFKQIDEDGKVIDQFVVTR